MFDTDVSSWHFADIPPAQTNVRYRGGHDANGPLCRKMTQVGPMRRAPP